MAEIPNGFEEIGSGVPEGFEELPPARGRWSSATPLDPVSQISRLFRFGPSAPQGFPGGFDLPRLMPPEPHLSTPLDMGLPAADGWHERGWGARALGRGYERTLGAFEGMGASARGENIGMVDKWADLTERMARPQIDPNEYRRLSTARSLLEREIRSAAPGDYNLADPAEREKLKGRLGVRAIENIKSVADREKTIATEYPREPETEAALNRKGEDFGTALSRFGNIFSETPFKTTTEIGLESALPSAAAIAAGVATRSPFTAATVMGFMSGSQEYGQGIFEVLRDAKVDTNSPQAVLDALKDPVKGAEIRALAAAKALPVATLDALSLGLGKFVLAPRALGAVGRQAINVPAQVAAQGLAGGLGEGLGQLAQKGKIENWGEIFAEIVGEAVGAPAEVAGVRGAIARDRRSLPNLATPTGPPSIPAPIPPAAPPMTGAPSLPPMPAPVPAVPEMAPQSMIPQGFELVPPGFTRDILRTDDWKAEIDFAGASRTAQGLSRNVMVTAPDGRQFSIQIEPHQASGPDDGPATEASIRNAAIREAQRRLAEGYRPTEPDFPPWLPEADRAQATRDYERERDAYGRGPIPPPKREAMLPQAEIIPPPVPHPVTGAPLRTPTGSPIPKPSSAIGRAAQGLDRIAPERTATFTPSGRRVEVAYEVVDLDQLTTSHTDDLRTNPQYPPELQPRDRDRAASEAQITEIASKLEPERLGRSTDATTGAPIVGPDLIVESGNGRVLALRRAYDNNPARAAAYMRWLTEQGYDASRFSRPVLIARRVSQLSPQERVEFALGANQASTLRMSASETAKVDAEIVRPILGQYRGGDVSFAQNAPFTRAFVNALPASERGPLLSAGGELTLEGTRRIQGALMQAAYGDAALVAKIFESPSNDIRSIGGALLDVAPAWAKMIESARRGAVSKDVDRTADLMAAVRAVEEARRKGQPASDVFNQGGLFSSLDTARDFGRLFFNDDKMTKPASRQSVAGRLRKYLDEAGKTKAGADMFGAQPASAKDILKATAGKEVPEGFEEVGGTTLRSGFDPTKPYQWYQRQAQKVLDFIHQRGGYKFAPLRNLPRSPEYLARRYETLGKLAEIDRIADHVFKAFRFVSKADKRAIYEYMTTAAARPDKIANIRARAEAVEAKRLIEEVGRRLVSRGMLPEEVFQEHRGTYLPRVYLKHLLGPRFGASRAKLDLGYLKARKDIDPEYRRLILGEITDPGYLTARGFDLPMRDMALADFLEQLVGDNEWVLRDSFVTWEGQQLSAAWLWHEAQRLRKMAEHVDPADRDAVIAKAIEMENVARPGLAIDKVEGYKQIPDSPKYGKLRGVWVRKEIWDDLFGNMGFLVDDPSFAERVLGQQGYITRLTQFWKLLKVPFNPPTVFRNAIGNIMLLQMSGVPLVRLPDRMIQAIAEMATGGRHWQIAKKYGVTNTNFAHNEMIRLNRWAQFTMAKSGQPLTKLVALAAGFADKAANFYGKLEAVAKTAKIIDAMEREGMSEKDAALEAHKAIFDYSLIPPTVRYLRNAPIGMPFVTFNYKVAPRLIELVTKNPWRLWPYVASAMLLPALAMEGLDIDEEEYRALKKTIPKYMRDRGHVFILPWRDEHGRFQYVDVSAFMPWNWFADVGGAAAKGDVGGTIHKSGFGGPFAQILVALESNVDPFTGRPIANKADPYGKQLGDSLHYAFKMMLPNWIADQGAADYMLKAMAGQVDKRTGQPRFTETQAAGRFLGVNTYPLDPQQSRASEVSRMNFELREIQKRMGRELFDQNLTPAQREAKREMYVRHYREKATELQQYLRDTAKAPRVPALPARR